MIISRAAKIIVGFTKHKERMSIHLHDRPDAVVVDTGRREVVMDQGPGHLRLQRTSFRFEDVLRCNAIPVALGHNCVDAPVDGSKLGSRERLKSKILFPISIQLLLRKCSLSFDLGTTANPLLVPCLNLTHTQVASADACVELCDLAIDWVRTFNDRIRWVQPEPDPLPYNQAQMCRKVIEGYTSKRDDTLGGGHLWRPNTSPTGALARSGAR